MTDDSSAQVENFNLNDFLPHGVMLRDLLRDSHVTEGDLRSMLYSRGIYTQLSDKDGTIPLLMTCLLSSSEFNLLRAKHFTREDNRKHKTVVVELDSDEGDLEKILGGRPEVAIPKYASYTLLKAPSFQRRDNGNELVIDYELKKPNRARDWSSHDTVHTGSLKIRKEGSSVRITSEFTANEVRDLNDSWLKDLEHRFKASGRVKSNNGILRILAGNLTNEERIKFLVSFTAGSFDGTLQFDKVPYVSFGPERGTQLPSSLQWMQNRVRSLMVRGESQSSLHDLQFITQTQYQKFIVLESVDATFLMQHRDYRIHCNLSYGFPKYLKTLNASIEFEVQVSGLTAQNSSGRRISLSNREIREAEARILKAFDETKIRNYKAVLGIQ